MRQPTIKKRLAATAGLEDLGESLVARLSAFAALHDIGKVNMGFQTQIWNSDELRWGPRPTRASHVNEMVPVITDRDYETADWFFERLGWDDLLGWDESGGTTACAMLIATLSHHGRPLSLDSELMENPAIWCRYGDLDPEECVERVGRLLRLWFPAAFAAGGQPLPCAPAFQHMFLGLCTWADWMGSDERYFRFCDQPDDDYIETARRRADRAVSALGLDVSLQRDRFRLKGVPEFAGLFGIDGPPNAIQRAATREVPLKRGLVIVESETGSGKTEAALWRFAGMYRKGLVDGLYFALPTRSAAVQIHGRVERFVSGLFPDCTPPVVLAVPGYDPGNHAEGVAMRYREPREEVGQRGDRPWASENPKRYLAAQFAVGTVDQAMLGALQVKNAHMRAACLARNLLIVDEVHASDTYMGAVLEALLNSHLGAGGHALLMSATLGSVARSRLLGRESGNVDEVPTLDEAVRTPYPAVSTSTDTGGSLIEVGESDQDKRVNIEASPTMHDFDGTARRALEAARRGARVLVVRNTVGHAMSTQMALEELAGADDAGLLFKLKGRTTLHHGRFAACDRAMLDRRVEEVLGRGRQPGGRVVVGTQTLEQSLDIDADLLLTDLCPVDVLLQRIGRLHRHSGIDRPNAHASPACIVLTPPGNDLARLLADGRNANGLGPKGHVYPRLAILEATRRLVAEHDEWRIPEMNRLLVERATHPDVLERIAGKMGEDWVEDETRAQGIRLSDRQFAKGHLVRRDLSFLDDNQQVQFADAEERVRTRLGDDRVRLDFAPRQPSPFDGSQGIDELAVSVRWLPDCAVHGAIAATAMDGGFTFQVGQKCFQYDRLGLRLWEQSQPVSDPARAGKLTPSAC